MTDRRLGGGQRDAPLPEWPLPVQHDGSRSCRAARSASLCAPREIRP
ncbi:MAG: hypothetical protein MZV64_23640 [Ignavibacteriales bacterium]|nr:hypothetical protein [Ignavibacteriales bacterium]